MAYCENCGLELGDGAAVCGGCGAAAGAPVTASIYINPAFRGLSDNWAWCLAFSPVFDVILNSLLYLLCPAFFEYLYEHNDDYNMLVRCFAAAVFFVVSAPFLFMDILEIKKTLLRNRDTLGSAAGDGGNKSGNVMGSVWLWMAAYMLLGLPCAAISYVVISIYLILRARKTNRRYGYAITGCVISVLLGAFILWPKDIKCEDIDDSTVSAQIVDTVSVQNNK